MNTALLHAALEAIAAGMILGLLVRGVAHEFVQMSEQHKDAVKR